MKVPYNVEELHRSVVHMLPRVLYKDLGCNIYVSHNSREGYYEVRIKHHHSVIREYFFRLDVTNKYASLRGYKGFSPFPRKDLAEWFSVSQGSIELDKKITELLETIYADDNMEIEDIQYVMNSSVTIFGKKEV